jgi:hypothetical protein
MDLPLLLPRSFYSFDRILLRVTLKNDTKAAAWPPFPATWLFYGAGQGCCFLTNEHKCARRAFSERLALD